MGINENTNHKVMKVLLAGRRLWGVKFIFSFLFRWKLLSDNLLLTSIVGNKYFYKNIFSRFSQRRTCLFCKKFTQRDYVIKSTFASDPMNHIYPTYKIQYRKRTRTLIFKFQFYRIYTLLCKTSFIIKKIR